LLTDHRFGVDAPFQLGVEEELLLVHPDSLALDPATERVLEEVSFADGRLKGEISHGMIELVTDVVPTAQDAVASLSHLRDEIQRTGVALLGSGLHPSAPLGAAVHRAGERYAQIGVDTRGLLRLTPHCGLHVHVGMPDPETAIKACNGMHRWIPLLQALSANSPFWYGRDSGLASARTVIAYSMPRSRSGIPRTFQDYADYVAATRRICGAADVRDYTMIWWDVRPHPRLGTLEVRCLDAQTSLDDVAGLAALTHCLAIHEANAPRPSPPLPELLAEASFCALRDGTAACFEFDGRRRQTREIARHALRIARSVATDLGAAPPLDGVERILANGNGADRQRAAWTAGGMPAVLRAVTIPRRSNRVSATAISLAGASGR
jgi:carboxylate-amine ligase